ncbi:hypothetical protein [Saccharolobus caldissimus]|uniref:Uncharacterized protein n=1 Tax=Saccharolobus caldissimus TaxID=1702097 RepID=A0AAQ4CNQ0_9CREN|nr:hypothetical protein [Saccharolobus caldissimus]BDB97431.1 hypothetical protein SACC_04480 [Saccharolobus caldissimus]
MKKWVINYTIEKLETIAEDLRSLADAYKMESEAREILRDSRTDILNLIEKLRKMN